MVPDDIEARRFKVEEEEQWIRDTGRSGTKELQVDSAVPSAQQQRLVDLAPAIVKHAALTCDPASLPCASQSRALRWGFELPHGFEHAYACIRVLLAPEK